MVKQTRIKDEPEDCEFIWNPGEWPYTTRCVLAPHHNGKHTDRKGHVPPEQVAHPLEVVTEAIVKAINVTGPSATYHDQQIMRLSKEWPTLAAALGDLLLAHRRPIPGPWRHAQNTLKQKGLRK